VRLALDDDQEFFRDTTRKFLDREMPVTRVRELYESAHGFDHDWWRAAAGLGWTSLLVPESHGGGSLSGSPLTDAVIVAEEIGRTLAPGPFLPVNVVADTLPRCSADGGAEALLAELLSGERIATWALAERSRAWDDDTFETLMRAVDGDVVVNGEKVFVEALAPSSHALVTATTDGGLSQVLVPLDAPGVTVRSGRSVDMTRRFGTLVLDDVRIPRAAVIGELGGAAPDVARQRCVALALQCAELVGVASRTLEFTVEYGLDRFAFGRPILSFQVLKHRVADMTQWLESSMAVADELATQFDAGAESVDRLARVAKAYVGDRVARIVDECVQIIGGIAVTWEHDIHMYNRRAILDRALYGSPEEHRDGIFRELADELRS
jgi:alkylation response protein AidB-like acyl-CoA dehydrogenase